IGGIVGGALIFLAALIPAFGNIRAAETGDALDLTEEIVEHVAPVADHVQDDAAAVLFPIVPGRALRLLPVTLEHPVAELAAHRKHAAEEAGVAQEGELLQARQE